MAGGMSVLRALSPLAAMLSGGGDKKSDKRKGSKTAEYKRGGKIRAKRGMKKRGGRKSSGR